MNKDEYKMMMMMTTTIDSVASLQRMYTRIEEPPRPVCPTGGEAKRRLVRPSVRRRSSTLQFDTRVRLINVMLEMPVIVAFTVSSSVLQSSPSPKL